MISHKPFRFSPCAIAIAGLSLCPSLVSRLIRLNSLFVSPVSSQATFHWLGIVPLRTSKEPKNTLAALRSQSFSNLFLVSLANRRDIAVFFFSWDVYK